MANNRNDAIPSVSGCAIRDQQGEQLAQQDKQLAQQASQLAASVKLMLESGISREVVAQALGIDIEDVIKYSIIFK